MWTGSRGHSGIGQMVFFPFFGFQPLLASARALVARCPPYLVRGIFDFQENCLSLISRDQTSLFSVPAKWVWAPGGGDGPPQRSLLYAMTNEGKERVTCPATGC